MRCAFRGRAWALDVEGNIEGNWGVVASRFSRNEERFFFRIERFFVMFITKTVKLSETAITLWKPVIS